MRNSTSRLYLTEGMLTTRSYRNWCWISMMALFIIAGCVKDGPSLLGPEGASTGGVASSLALSNPGTIYQGGQYTFSGSCAPNGSIVTISLPAATPSQVGNCACNGATFNCPATTLSAVPTPAFNVTAQNDRGDTSQVTVSTAIPSITLNDPGFLSSGDNVTFTGTCSPDALAVDITLTTASPSTISGCTCSSGSFSCPPTVLTGFSTPLLVVNASNFSGSTKSQNVFTSRTAYATPATPPVTYGTNMTMSLVLTGPSALPGNQVSITSSCFGGACTFGSWDPAGTAVGNFTLLGFSFLTSTIFPTDNSPPYLDVTGNANRTLTIDFGASPSSLDTVGSKYYFWIAMAGLGASPEFATVTSNRSLQVIGYQDSFSTGDFSYLDGAPTVLGSVGTAVSTKPASGSNGYTFYLIRDRSVSTIQLSYVHGATADFHGFILGAIEIRNQ